MQAHTKAASVLENKFCHLIICLLFKDNEVFSSQICLVHAEIEVDYHVWRFTQEFLILGFCCQEKIYIF
jgi:hypothetical protein